MNSIPFSRTTFYISVGISALNTDLCCVCVDTVKPEDYILTPTQDTPYVVHRIFTFAAPKKVPFVTLISNLQSVGIEPVDGFKPQVNPGNKIYSKLMAGYYPVIIDVIVKTIEGISIRCDSHSFTVEEVSDEELANAMDRVESTLITTFNPVQAVFLGAKTSHAVHKLPQPATPEPVRRHGCDRLVC
jgi:hypothetical protein